MNYTTIQFLMLCCLFGIILSFFFLCLSIPKIFYKWQSGDKASKAWISVPICIAVLIIAIISYFSLASKENQYLVDRVSSGYSVYYNGEAIDGTKVNFNDYSVSIDEEKEEIYLADKPFRSRRYVPVVYPR